MNKKSKTTEKTAVKKYGGALLEPYNREACEVCGRCLMECPVMGLSEAEAKKEMTAMREGRPGRRVLENCETCMACNLVCPNGANPMMLFQQRFYEEHQRAGLPEWSQYFQPHEPGNFRADMIAQHTPAEKKLLAKWTDMSPCEEFAYAGCNICSAPYLTQAKFLQDLNIRGSVDYCCGEMYFRTGMLDQLRQTAARLNLYFEKLGASRMMVLCTAGYNIFTNVLPRYGLETNMEITSYLPWLWQKLESGEIEVKKPLDMTVTIQESCHAKVIGPEYYELPRKIAEKLGCKVKEMRHSKECAYCCGIGGGFPAKKNYHPLAITRATLRAVYEADRAGSDAVMAYCAGCFVSFSAGLAVYPTRKPVFHVFEMVQMAAGETPKRFNTARGRQFLFGVMKKQMPKALSRKHFPAPDISVEP
ncbi:MAG: (Fe-S)-binding protein [bacterium]